MLKFLNQTYKQDRELFTIHQLELKPGEFVALIGANGTGKSTWLRSIVHPSDSSNNFTINSAKATDMGQLEIAKQIAFIDNRFAGLDHLTVEEYISLGRFPYTGMSGRLDDADRSIIQEVAKRLKIEHLLKKSTADLSDGERQKCGIAKALVQETPIILLDEPTSFLDYPSKQDLFRILKEIVSVQNKLVIVSTHDIDLSLEYATKWCILCPDHSFRIIESKPGKVDMLAIAFGL